MIDMTYWIEETKEKIGVVAVLKHFWYVFLIIVVICIVIVEEIYKISGLISENKDFTHYRYIPNSGTYKITYIKNNKKNTAELYINENKICILDENNEIIGPDN